MKKNTWIIACTILFVLVALGVGIPRVVRAVTSNAILAKNAALGLQDSTPAIWVNDRTIPAGTVEGLANTYTETQGIDRETAYQDAVNLLVQNSLLLQEAKKRGLTATDQEVEDRVSQQLQDAKDNNASLREAYQAQAEAMGMTWDSPEFKDYLKKQLADYFPAEKLNILLDQQADGNTQKLVEAKAQLLESLFASANVRIDTSALPTDAKNIHIPQLSELPDVQAISQGATTITP